MMGSLVELGLWQVTFWWLLLSVLTAAAWVTFGGQHRRQWADHEAAWWLWHWFTGGRLESGRSFPPDESRPRYLLRRAAVALARTGLGAAHLAALYIQSGSPGRLSASGLAGVSLAAMVVVSVMTLLIIHVAVRVAHQLQWVRPLHRAVHKLAGWDEEKRARSYLTIPRNRADDDEGVVVGLAPNFDPRHQEAVEVVVKRKLDLGAVVVTPTFAGRHSYLQFRPQKPMPAYAPFKDPKVRRALEDAVESRPVVGFTRGWEPVTIDVARESPHILFSAGTGGGKSSTMMLLAAHFMRHGANVIIIDFKRHSHRWLYELPGVWYARDEKEMHRALVAAGREGRWRNEQWDGIGLRDKGPTFKRTVVLCEELSSTMSMLQHWWKANREPGEPVPSPAVTALKQILCMGRAVRMNVIAVAQYATARDLGGPEMRENYAARILANYSPQAAKTVVPECNLPPAGSHPGRAWVCIRGKAIETQLVYIEEEEAEAWVADVRGMQPKGQAVDVATVAGHRTVVDQGERPVTVADAEDTLTLPEASSDLGSGVVPMRYDALRKAVERARGTSDEIAVVGRRGAADLYRRTDVERLRVNRPRGANEVSLVDGRNEGDGVDRMEARDRA